MRKASKMLAAALSLTMACALAVPAYAVDITIQENSAISTYATERSYNGYKLLNLTTSTNDDEDETVNYAYTVNEKYHSVLQTQVHAAAGEDFWTENGGSKPAAATNVTDTQILAYLASLGSDEGGNPGTLRSFADDLYAAIVADSIAADETAHDDVFDDVDQGYWLIADVTELEGTGEANSLVVVDTKGQDSITVTPKTDVPKVEKKVKEENDSTGVTSDWQDGADYDIGDDVPFQLTGTMPSNIANYETYTYIFHDDLSDGLELNEDTITVKIGDKDTSKYITLVKGTDYTLKASPTDTHEDFVCDFEIVFDNLYALETTYAEQNLEITKDTVIVVEYTAKLTGEDVVIGNPGNPNEVYLEFSNNPYDEGTGKTPEDKVTVFTFTLDVDKVDGENQPLAGAGFTLYKYDADTQSYVAVGSEVKGDELTDFVWTGLDSGKYKLVETTPPAGYNKADDIEFTIEATYTTDGDTQSVTNLVVKDAEGELISGEGLTFTATPATGIVATDVVNTTGVELPETGGMGTTIFYIVGGILVVGAGVLLITKKRMNAGSEQ